MAKDFNYIAVFEEMYSLSYQREETNCVYAISLSLSVNFLASENWCGRVQFEGHLPERRVLSKFSVACVAGVKRGGVGEEEDTQAKFSAPHPSPPSWTSGQVAWLPIRIMREPGYDFNNKKMAESFTEYNMEFGFKILKKHDM